MRSLKLLGGLLCATLLGAQTPGGNLKCGSCHTKEAQTQPGTSMALAFHFTGTDPTLQAHPKLTFQQGAYQYTIERHGDASIYTVTDGKDTLSLPILWALGANSQTYVL